MNLEQRLVEKFGPSSVFLIPKMKETAGSEELAANVVSCMIPDDVPSVISFKTIRGENATSLTSGDDLADSNSFFFDDKRVVTFGAKAYFTSLPLIYSSYEDDLFSLFISRSDVCVRFDTDGRYVRVDGDDRFMDTAITTQGNDLQCLKMQRRITINLQINFAKFFQSLILKMKLKFCFEMDILFLFQLAYQKFTLLRRLTHSHITLSSLNACPTNNSKRLSNTIILLQKHERKVLQKSLTI